MTRCSTQPLETRYCLNCCSFLACACYSETTGSSSSCSRCYIMMLINKKMLIDYSVCSKIKPIKLYMSRSGWNSASSYETPLRTGKESSPKEAMYKQTPPTASPDSNLYPSQSQPEASYTKSPGQQVTIEISRKSAKSPSSPFNPKEILEQLYSRYENLSAEELMEVIATYEAQIEDLKLYIHRADLLDRSKIG